MIKQLFALDREDKASVALLFAYGYGNAASYVLARTVADSAFLSRFGSDRLPELYMLSAGVVALSSIVYGYYLRRFGLSATVVTTLALFAVGSLALSVLMSQDSASLIVYAAAYLLAQIRGSLGTIQYATVLNEQFGKRQPERIVGLAGAGATLAGISMGFLIGFGSDEFPIEQLLLIAAGIDVLTALPLLALRKRLRPAWSATQAADSPGMDWLHVNRADNSRIRYSYFLRSKYVASIASIVTLSILATTLVEYQWKVTAADELNRDAGQLAKYFGFFYAVVYTLTGLMQLFITSQVLLKRGVLVGLIALPVSLLITTVFAWSASNERLLLWTLTLCKATDVLRRSLHDPTLQILYGPLERDVRRHAITFVAGIAKPFAEALAGVCMVLLAFWLSTQQLSPIVFAIICCWLALCVPLWRWYSRFRKGRFELSGFEEAEHS